MGAAIFACLTTTFFTVALLGELTVKNLSSFDVEGHVKVADIWHDVKGRSGNKVTTFHIPQTKVVPKEKGRETVVWAQLEGPVNLSAAFTNHLEFNQPPQLAHLFVYWHNGSHSPLTKTIFFAHLKRALKDAGRPTKHGHNNICIGGTLEYLLRGVLFKVTKSIGRWSSDSFSKYLRKHAQILAPYVQANPDLHQSHTS